jgi:hypothetical protein
MILKSNPQMREIHSALADLFFLFFLFLLLLAALVATTAATTTASSSSSGHGAACGTELKLVEVAQ